MAKDEEAIEEAKRKKAEKKAEKLRQAEELRIQQRKEDIELELELERFNKKLTKVKFDEVALRRNFPLITDNMKQAKATFEKVLDSKNTLINFLIERVKHSRLQRDFASQYQIEIFDSIIGMYASELQTLFKNYIKDRDSILMRRYRFELKSQSHVDRKRDDMIVIYNSMKDDQEEIMKDMKGDNLRIAEDAEKQNRTDFYEMCQKNESALQDIWRTYNKEFEDYKASTYGLKKEYKELKLKDSEDDATIKKLSAKISKLEGYIKEFDEKLPSDELNSPRGEKIKDLEQEKNTFAKAYDRLRRQIKVESKRDLDQITLLSASTHNTLQKLENLKSKGELCLKVMMMCSKYETEAEKVVPVPQRALSIEFLPKEDEHLNDLENLWHKHTQIILQNRYMKHLIDQLKKEEFQMRERLKYVLLEIGEVPSKVP